VDKFNQGPGFTPGPTHKGGRKMWDWNNAIRIEEEKQATFDANIFSSWVIGDLETVAANGELLKQVRSLHTNEGKKKFTDGEYSFLSLKYYLTALIAVEINLREKTSVEDELAQEITLLLENLEVKFNIKNELIKPFKENIDNPYWRNRVKDNILKAFGMDEFPFWYFLDLKDVMPTHKGVVK
jgi:hypothetical protein